MEFVSANVSMANYCGWGAHRTYNLLLKTGITVLCIPYLLSYPQINVAFTPHLIKEASFCRRWGLLQKPQLVKMQRTFTWVLSPN